MRSHDVFNDVIVPSTIEIYHFQHERVTDFRKMFQDMLTTQISFRSTYNSNVSRIAFSIIVIHAIKYLCHLLY